MNPLGKTRITCTFLWLGLTASAQYISIDDNYTTSQLVNDVLIGNPCAQASNIAVSGWSFGNGNTFAYFESNESGFPFENGIVLTTGRAASAVGPNTSILSEGPTGWNGDSDLENALGVSNTINATVLEFDFTPLANRFSFDYIFSSEQYLSNPSQNQCGYTDGFAFLLKKVGSDIPYENLAVIPNSNIPVTVNNVRGAGTICPVANAEYFDAFNGAQHPTNYNGQTVVMTASANVEPNQLYHIKIVIADQGNNLYDSAIFLGGGSFNLNKDFGPDLLVSNGYALCEGETHLLDATESGASNYQWFKNNVALPGETNPTYIVTEAGIYRAEFMLSPTCAAFGEISIEYVPKPQINEIATLIQCDPDANGITEFNLPQVISLITNNNPELNSVTFYESLDAGSIPIPNPYAYSAGASSQVYAVVLSSFCSLTATVILDISNETASDRAITLCAEYGPNTIDLAAQVTPEILDGLPAGLVPQYYASPNDALLQSDPLTNTLTLSGNQQVIYARIVNGPQCYDIIAVTLTVEFFNPDDFENETFTICGGGSVSLSVDAGFSSYLWSTGDTDSQITVTAAGNYSVTVTNANGCEATKQFLVETFDAPVFVSAQVHDFDSTGNSITIAYQGSGSYEFSLDGNFFQPSPDFHHVAPGEYTVYIRDTTGCYLVGPYTVYVSDFPRYFTPNGDGIHDYWEPSLHTTEPVSISIFDRYGKLLLALDGNGAWDGKYGSRELPATDYWFVIAFRSGRVVKGHFSLKR